MLSALTYLMALLIMPSMVAKLIFLVKGSVSLKVILLFLAIAVVSSPRVRLSGGIALHFLMFSYFVLIAVAQPTWATNSVTLSDLLQAVQALAAVPVLVVFLDTSGMTKRFVLDTARLLVALGVVASAIGLVKFYLMSRGIMLEGLFLDGMYPPGTALQQDYNLFALGLLVCLSAVLWVRSQPQVGRVFRVVCNLAIPLLALTVTLSSSRRGVLFLALLILFYVVVEDSASRAGVRWAPRQLAPLVVVGLVGVLLVGVLSESANPALEMLRQSFNFADATSRLTDFGQSAKLVESRAPLWQYAWAQVSGVYTLPQLLFGRGVSYLAEMGAVFRSPVGYEYPHNFLLASLLHGGLVLTTMMVVLVGGAMRTFWSARAAYGVLTMTFGLTLAFGLSSSNSIYSNELLYFLTVVAASSGGILRGSVGRLAARAEASSTPLETAVGPLFPVIPKFRRR